ncbi:hypothetical protein DRN50_02300 [Thermococci archaeon]|nr:MAG: hypothetical protein DRN50_02300 [Thermococci archaeon]
MLFRSQKKVKKTEVESWIEKRYTSKSEEIMRDSERYINKIEDSEQKIKNFLNEFKFMTPNERIFKKIYKIALSSQDKFINSLLLTTEKINTNYSDIDSLKEVHKNLVETVGSIQKYIGMHGRYLMIVYEREMKLLSRFLKDFDGNIEKLGNLLKDSEFVAIENIMNIISENKSKKIEIEENKSKILDIKKEIEEKKIKIEDKKKELSKVKDMAKGEKEKMEEYKELKKQFKKIENEIYSTIAPLKREMRKLEKIVTDKKLKKQIQEYIEFPVKTFLNDSDLNVFRESIPNIEKIEKNPRKREKILRLIEYVLDGNLEDKKKEYMAYKEKVDSFVITSREENKEGIIKRKIDNLQSEIIKSEEKIKNLETKNDLLQKEILKSEEDIIEILEKDLDVKVQE